MINLYVAQNEANEELIRPLYHQYDYIMDEPITTTTATTDDPCTNCEVIPHVVYDCFPSDSLRQNQHYTEINSENNPVSNDVSDYLIPKTTIRQVYNNAKFEPTRDVEVNTEHPVVYMTMTL